MTKFFSSRYYLSPMGEEDLGALVAIVSNPKFEYPYITGGIGNDEQKIQERCQAYVDYAEAVRGTKDQFWAIRDAEQHGLMIGAVILADFDKRAPDNAEIGVFMQVEHQNSPIAFAALASTMKRACEQDGLKSLHITTDPENERVIHMVQRVFGDDSSVVERSYIAETAYATRFGESQGRPRHQWTIKDVPGLLKAYALKLNGSGRLPLLELREGVAGRSEYNPYRTTDLRSVFKPA